MLVGFVMGIGAACSPKAVQTEKKARTADAEKLNVVFILADDLGYTDLGCYGSTFYETPNLDALAKDGMKFNRAYAACQVCSPTRASLLTGKYPVRTGITDFINHQNKNQPEGYTRNTPLLPARYQNKLALEEFTLAEALKAAGYKTFFAGKWHLGIQGFWPENQGFDINIGGHATGSPGKGGYFSPYNNPRLPDGPAQEYLPERLSRETAAFIRRHKSQPFFVYHSLYLVHTPLLARQELIAKYEKKMQALQLADKFGAEGQSKVRLNQTYPVYAAMMEAMDQAVGEIVTTLKQEGLYEKTLIIFTSDNGGLSTSEGHPTSNLPLRAGKGWMYEGGIREPLLVRWPGVTKPGATSEAVVSSPDFYPTILSIAGQPLRPEQHVDGQSFVAALKGARQANRPIYWHYPHYSNQGGGPRSAIMEGDLKLIKWYGPGAASYEFYNVKADIGEKQDISASHLQQVAAMKARLETFLQETGARYPAVNPKYRAASNE